MHGWHKWDGSRDAIGRGTSNEGEMKMNNEKCLLAKYRRDRATLLQTCNSKTPRNIIRSTRRNCRSPKWSQRAKINGCDFRLLSWPSFFWDAESVGELHDTRRGRALLIVTCVSLDNQMGLRNIRSKLKFAFNRVIGIVINFMRTASS